MGENKRESVSGDDISNIVRVPITGLRQPIKWEDVCDPEMTWEIQYKKLNNYIKFVASQVVSGLQSAMLSSEDLYQEGLILLYNCFERYRLKPEKEFQSLFKSSCWRLLKGFCYKKKEFQTVELDEVYELGYNDNDIQDLYEEFKLQQVKELVASNQLSIRILEEILNPSTATIWELHMDFYRKETLKNQGKRSFLPTEMEIKPAMIQRSLGVSKKEFNEAFKELQSSVYAIYSSDTRIKSYTETDSMTDEEFETKYKELLNLIHRVRTA